ncbi:glycosyltransferase family 4 protein [Citrobacter freundii]|uniref:glycosyltransferase family 4 protein n=1 Tax=Citrobacter freundii TaxID=546 RepID=UPI003F8ECE8C
MIFLDGIIFSLQKSGGISVYFNELMLFLSDKKKKYDFAIYPNDNKSLSNDVVNCRYRMSISIERFLRCKDISIGTHIFHSSYYRLPSKSYKGKVITTVHDFTDEIFPRGVKSKILSCQKRKAILKSDGIICISENTKKDLLKFIPEAKNIPIKVIYNGVAEFSPDKKDSTLSSLYVLFIGARKQYKNFDLCVKSLSRYENLNLIIVGGGELDINEIKLLDEYLYGRYVKENHVDEQRLNYLYSNAFFLFYPSQYEGFGIPVIEAMRSGCPVIATNCSSISEIASGYALLANEASVEEFVYCIDKLFDNNMRHKLISNGQQHAQKFSWNKCFTETIQFYDEVRDLK